MKTIRALNGDSRAVYIGTKRERIYSSVEFDTYESIDNFVLKRYDIWYIDGYVRDENKILGIIDLKPKLVIFGEISLNEMYKRRIVKYASFKNIPILGAYSSGVYSKHFYFGRINPALFDNRAGVCVISSNRFIPYMIAKELSWYDWGISQCITIGRGDGIMASYEKVLENVSDFDECHGMIVHIDLNNYVEASMAGYIKKRYGKPIIVFVTGRSSHPEKGYKLIKLFRDANIDVALDIGEVVKMLKKIV